MSFVHSKDARVFVNERHLSCEIRGYTVSHERDMSDSTVLCDDGHRFVPGLLNGSVSLDGLFQSDAGDTGTDFIHEVLQSTINVDNGTVVTACPAGFGTAGNPAFITRADASSYEIESSVSDVVSLSYEAQPDNGVDWGVNLTTHTAIEETGTGTELDQGASSANGGVASLHITAVSGSSPTATIVVQHSADGDTYADLISFTEATEIGHQYGTVTGTVNQHVQAEYTIGGTDPSFTFLLAFARR